MFVWVFHSTNAGSWKLAMHAQCYFKQIIIVITCQGIKLVFFSYLGIVINEKLSWNYHIKHIRSKINKKLGLLRRIKAYLPLSARFTFINSFVLQHFDHGDIIWCVRENSTLMDDLQALQNKTPRIILVLPPRAFSSDALAKFHWKPLLPRNAWHRDIFVNKLYNLLNDMTVITASLSAIISKSSNTEDFPLKWKTAKISPCI